MWVDNLEELGMSPNNIFYDWLSKPTVLTAAIKSKCKEFSLHVISQELTTAEPTEQEALEIDGTETNSLVREVCLQGDGIPWVYGRVVVPNVCYQLFKEQFDSLGNKPLGETLFYGHIDFKRKGFSYSTIEHNNYLFTRSTSIEPRQGTKILFARRAILERTHLKLLVTETFLPNIPRYTI